VFENIPILPVGEPIYFQIYPCHMNGAYRSGIAVDCGGTCAIRFLEGRGARLGNERTRDGKRG
jgi:hypothetical protein